MLIPRDVGRHVQGKRRLADAWTGGKDDEPTGREDWTNHVIKRAEARLNERQVFASVEPRSEVNHRGIGKDALTSLTNPTRERLRCRSGRFLCLDLIALPCEGLRRL